MCAEFKPQLGARGFQLSNPSVLDTVALIASLQIFEKTDMKIIRQKSMLLTAYLVDGLDRIEQPRAGNFIFEIITPRNPAERGAQISISFREAKHMEHVLETLEAAGVVCDERRPNVLRIAPAPLYNRFMDVYNCVSVIKRALQALK
jgi:kynureninase